MRSRAAAASLILVALVQHAAAKDRPPRKDDDDKRATGCEYLGRDYVKLPGSDTCMKVTGFSRTEGSVMFGR